MKFFKGADVSSLTEVSTAHTMEDYKEYEKLPDERRGCGFCYWEPAWLPVPGSGWASEAGIAYMKEKGPSGNEWANQGLFDYDGNALPALKVIRDFEKRTGNRAFFVVE